jgi:hypothetical protein
LLDRALTALNRIGYHSSDGMKLKVAARHVRNSPRYRSPADAIVHPGPLRHSGGPMRANKADALPLGSVGNQHINKLG